MSWCYSQEQAPQVTPKRNVSSGQTFQGTDGAHGSPMLSKRGVVQSTPSFDAPPRFLNDSSITPIRSSNQIEISPLRLRSLDTRIFSFEALNDNFQENQPDTSEPFGETKSYHNPAHGIPVEQQEDLNDDPFRHMGTRVRYSAKKTKVSIPSPSMSTPVKNRNRAPESSLPQICCLAATENPQTPQSATATNDPFQHMGSSRSQKSGETSMVSVLSASAAHSNKSLTRTHQNKMVVTTSAGDDVFEQMRFSRSRKITPATTPFASTSGTSIMSARTQTSNEIISSQRSTISPTSLPGKSALISSHSASPSFFGMESIRVKKENVENGNPFYRPTAFERNAGKYSVMPKTEAKREVTEDTHLALALAAQGNVAGHRIFKTETVEHTNSLLTSATPKQSRSTAIPSKTNHHPSLLCIDEGKLPPSPSLQSRTRNIADELKAASHRATSHQQYFSARGSGTQAFIKLFSGSSPVSPYISALYSAPPTKLKGVNPNLVLKPHQNVARVWMAGAEKDQRRMGGILADEMGLGKTVETLIRFIDHRCELDSLSGEKTLKMPTLIVCLKAVLEQWNDEIKNFLSLKLNVIVFHAEVLGQKAIKNLKMFDLLNADIIIATYDKVRQQYDDLNFLPESYRKATTFVAGNDILPIAEETSANLFAINFTRIVLDEAHAIKNPSSQRSRACFALEGEFRWALSGTPIQNNAMDLYSLFKFLRIAPLNDLRWFKIEIIEPLKSNSQYALDLLRITKNITVLRRLKSDELPNGHKILELEEMKIRTVYCELNPMERAFYTAFETKIANGLTHILNDAALRADPQRCLHAKYMIVRITKLRQACLHPKLVLKDDEFDEEVEIASGETDHIELAWDKCEFCGLQILVNKTRKHRQTCNGIRVLLDQTYREEFISTKVKYTLKLLKIIEKRNEKTIIFSQFTSMLDIVEDSLQRVNVSYSRYDGEMNTKQRSDALKAIKGKDVNVMLMSLRAGGVGLNLTECNNVILVDPWWNPAVEEQAFGRVHRIGQTRKVNVYKLIAIDTIEERIVELQEAKLKLANDVLDSQESKTIGNLSLNEKIELVTGRRKLTRM